MATMYLWLKEDGAEGLEALKEKGLLGWDFRPETHRGTGKKFLGVYEDLDPILEVVPEEIVGRVTMKEQIYRNFRSEGVYRHEGAELTVKTDLRIHSESTATNIEREEYQEISVSGPSVRAAKTIFTLVRQGKLLPEENWEVEPYRVSTPEPATSS